jgi:hypothetical protein
MFLLVRAVFKLVDIFVSYRLLERWTLQEVCARRTVSLPNPISAGVGVLLAAPSYGLKVMG